MKLFLSLIAALVLTGAAQAKLFLLLDERLRATPLEQSIYRFVPLTNASEVELNYVKDFTRGDAALEYARKVKESDRAFYIGADRWPEDDALKKLTARREWSDLLGKVSFLVENNAPQYAAMPKGMFARNLLWKKYAEVTATRYLGIFNMHTLDARPQVLEGSRWESYNCVHESGELFLPGRKSPLVMTKGGFSLTYRNKAQMRYAGSFVCIQIPKADAIFEVHAPKADVSLSVPAARFSAWNEARPLLLTVRSDRFITAPLALKIVPEVNRSIVDFVFQGEKISCELGKCQKRDAKFLMPVLSERENNFELAYRGQGDGFFRGDLVLLAGDVEIARTQIRLTPHSWVAESLYALQNPSEYKTLFLQSGLLFLLAILLLYAFYRILLRLVALLKEKRTQVLPRQSSVSLEIIPGMAFRITATDNPFGCELADFGGLVEIDCLPASVTVRHGNRGAQEFDYDRLNYRFPDGYRLITTSVAPGRWRLDLFYVSETDSLPTSATLSQTQDQDAGHAAHS